MLKKAVKSLQSANNEFNKALEKELNTLDIHTERLLQAFYIFIGDIKYTLKIRKHPDKYEYKISLYCLQKESPSYVGNMCFDIHTGNIKIISTYLNTIGTDPTM